MTPSPLAALEGEPSRFNDDAAAGLVLAGLESGSQWWAGRALHWVEAGVGGAAVIAACRKAATDQRYPTEIRARAERMSRPNLFTASAEAFGPPGEGYFWARDIFFHRGWRAAAVSVPVLLGAALFATSDGDPGAGVFLTVGAAAWGLYGLARWRDRSEDRG